jgi:hypothetical protein
MMQFHMSFLNVVSKYYSSVVILAFLAIVSCSYEWTELHRADNNKYTAIMKVQSSDVTTPVVLSTNIIDRNSVLKAEHEIIRIIGIHKEGSLILGDNNILNVNTYYGADNMSQYFFVMNLDCDFIGFEIRSNNKWVLGDEHYAYESDSLNVKISSLGGMPYAFNISIKKTYGAHFLANIFVLGSSEVKIERIENDEVVMASLWNCNSEPAEIIFSLKSNEILLPDYN